MANIMSIHTYTSSGYFLCKAQDFIRNWGRPSFPSTSNFPNQGEILVSPCDFYTSQEALWTFFSPGYVLVTFLDSKLYIWNISYPYKQWEASLTACSVPILNLWYGKPFRGGRPPFYPIYVVIFLKMGSREYCKF